MRVLYHQSVKDSLFELIEVLYNEEYFGFYKSAINYMTELKTEIELSIASLPIKKLLNILINIGITLLTLPSVRIKIHNGIFSSTKKRRRLLYLFNCEQSYRFTIPISLKGALA